VGKDILTTHTVYWPTMLKALGVEQPRTVFAHGWWLFGEAKMSKSLGNVVNPMDMMDRFGVDAFRYFLMAEMIPGQDASFTEDAFIRRYNADLANDLGNLLSRVTNMTRRFCDGKVPAAPASYDAEASEVRATVLAAVDSLLASLPTFRLDQGLTEILNAVKRVNKYLEEKQPWTLARDPDKSGVNAVMYVAAESLRILSQLLEPVMPAKMAELRSTLGLRGPCTLAELKQFGIFPAGREVAEPGPLFPRIERKETPAPVVATPAAPAPVEGLIEYADFAKVQFRTARVLEAEKVAGADKLLKLQIQVGEERRQIIAGIAKSYTPEQIVGKTVVVVANLKPAKIRGVESNGMLLAASVGDQLRVVTVDGDLPPGAVVK
jgi:methionyl-tRNA synthetase